MSAAPDGSWVATFWACLCHGGHKEDRNYALGHLGWSTDSPQAAWTALLDAGVKGTCCLQMEGHRGLQAEGPLALGQEKDHEWDQDRNVVDVELELAGHQVQLGIWDQDVDHLSGNPGKKEKHYKQPSRGDFTHFK